MATWPASLPQAPQREGFRREPGSGVVRSNPDHGPQQIRRRFTATEDRIVATYIMEFAQWETLLAFFKTTVAYGSLAFDWPDPVAGATVEVTFDAPPQIVRQRGGPWVDVAVQLRQQPG